MALQIFAILPNSDEEVLFSDCADIPYEVTLSDNINFEVESRASKCKSIYVSFIFDVTQKGAFSEYPKPNVITKIVTPTPFFAWHH